MPPGWMPPGWMPPGWMPGAVAPRTPLCTPLARALAAPPLPRVNAHGSLRYMYLSVAENYPPMFSPGMPMILDTTVGQEMRLTLNATDRENNPVRYQIQTIINNSEWTLGRK